MRGFVTRFRYSLWTSAVIMAALAGLGASWAWIFTLQHKDIAQAHNRLVAMQSLAAQEQDLSALLAQSKARLGDGEWSLKGGTEAQAASDLQSSIGQIAQHNRCAVISVSGGPPRPLGGVEKVAVVTSIFQMTCDIIGLSDMLFAIEEEKPALVVDGLSVTARQTRAGRDQPMTTDGVLQVVLTVKGFAVLSAEG